MIKTLKVVKPFYVDNNLEIKVNEIFEWSEDEGLYINENTSVYNPDDSSEDTDTFSSTTKTYISIGYAARLLKYGFLKDTEDVKTKDNFVNIFDEIESLKNEYTKQLNGLIEEYKDSPACLKVEKQTVLTNLINLLNHLGSLKK